MSNIKKGIKALIFVLILFMSMNNIKAIGTDMENDLKYIPNMEVEKLIDDHNIILPTKPTRAASGSVVEKI
ncbi:MAG: hypothetical protein LBT75_02075, partial [Bacilli bacterium]|nr:hypothetical protein [Bacilli bacterium]